jgi:hypothetical protein
MGGSMQEHRLFKVFDPILTYEKDRLLDWIGNPDSDIKNTHDFVDAGGHRINFDFVPERYRSDLYVLGHYFYNMIGELGAGRLEAYIAMTPQEFQEATIIAKNRLKSYALGSDGGKSDPEFLEEIDRILKSPESLCAYMHENLQDLFNDGCRLPYKKKIEKIVYMKADVPLLATTTWTVADEKTKRVFEEAYAVALTGILLQLDDILSGLFANDALTVLQKVMPFMDTYYLLDAQTVAFLQEFNRKVFYSEIGRKGGKAGRQIDPAKFEKSLDEHVRKHGIGNITNTFDAQASEIFHVQKETASKKRQKILRERKAREGTHKKTDIASELCAF